LGVISLFFIWEIAKHHNNKKRSKLPPPPPAIPGLPVLGNMLQLKEMKPFKTFAKWAEEYGPIYSIRTGANRMVVLNSATVAKEALVTRHSSISAKKLSNAVTILTAGKIIAMSDYNEFYKNAKRNLLNSILGANVQKRYRFLRDDMIDGIYEQLLAHSRDAHTSEKAVDFRAIFQTELFRLAMKQDLGEAVESLYVEEFGKTLSIDEIYKILVVDPVKGSAAVDWREFFPYLKWIPNRAFTERLQQLVYKRRIVMEEIIRQQKQHLAAGSVTKSYLQHLLFEADFALSDEELMILVWESLVEADTTAVAAEWAMYELSKHPQIQ
ncbi:ent-kaurene oxidase 2, partial [Genlisea aurea]